MALAQQAGEMERLQPLLQPPVSKRGSTCAAYVASAAKDGPKICWDHLNSPVLNHSWAPTSGGHPSSRHQRLGSLHTDRWDSKAAGSPSQQPHVSTPLPSTYPPLWKPIAYPRGSRVMKRAAPKKQDMLANLAASTTAFERKTGSVEGML